MNRPPGRRLLNLSLAGHAPGTVEQAVATTDIQPGPHHRRPQERHRSNHQGTARERIEIDKFQRARWKSQKRTGDALPQQVQAVIETGRLFVFQDGEDVK